MLRSYEYNTNENDLQQDSDSPLFFLFCNVEILTAGNPSRCGAVWSDGGLRAVPAGGITRGCSGLPLRTHTAMHRLPPV